MWVVKLPQDSEYIYAVGSCPKTHVREDAEPRAEDNAKQELSRSIKVEVRSVMVGLEGVEGQTGSYSQLHEEKSFKVDDILLEAILDKAELVEYWFDKGGITGEKENTYALVRIPRGEIRNKMGDINLKKTGGFEASSDYFSPPSWLTEIPQDDIYIYAIGSCSKTYRRKDAEERALENARVELSRSISLEIQSVVFDIHRSRGGSSRITDYNQEISVRMDKYVSEAVLSGSQAVAIWYDNRGLAGDKGNTYALVRISREGVIEGFSGQE
ncbi:MAG: LPP20 family lipoprotein [Deltaproteobacteria bacterium]|nr:MAG: LPP20 family lipoprotein [Deltaproteobacteria bacterium]